MGLNMFRADLLRITVLSTINSYAVYILSEVYVTPTPPSCLVSDLQNIRVEHVSRIYIDALYLGYQIFIVVWELFSDRDRTVHVGKVPDTFGRGLA